MTAPEPPPVVSSWITANPIGWTAQQQQKAAALSNTREGMSVQGLIVGWTLPQGKGM